MGFCMGVRRAVEKATDIITIQPGKQVYTLGPLIHNRLCIEDLEAKGILSVSSLNAIETGSTVIVRAHGIPPLLRDELLSKGVELINASCPRVIRSQNVVKEYSERNYHIVIVGDRDHGEIVGIAGYAKTYDIIENEKEASSLDISEEDIAGILVIGQTTLRQEEYDRLSAIIREKYPHAEVINSICPATTQRQKSLLDLAKKVNAFVIVGGRNSANTTRLYRTALSTGKPVWHIEEARELPDEVFRYNRVGISAGASTPDRLVDEVEERLRRPGGTDKP